MLIQRSQITKYSLFLLLFLLGSCYEPEEGCLDSRATNYNLNTDLICEDCCVYPSIKVNTQLIFDTLPFLFDSLFTNDIDFSFRVHDLKIVLSNFSYLGSDQTIYQTTEVLENFNAIRSDQYLISSISNTTTLGTLIPPMEFNNISFDLGLQNEINDTSLIFSSGTIMNTFISDSCTIESSFPMFQIQFSTIEKDTFDLALSKSQLNISLDTIQILEEGQDIDISFLVDMSELFGGLDTDIQNEDVLKINFESNISTIFEVE